MGTEQYKMIFLIRVRGVGADSKPLHALVCFLASNTVKSAL
jgi:hypothetical protein